MEQGMSWREERGTGNVMEKIAWNKECHMGGEWSSERKAWERECHEGRNVEQEITWSEWLGTRNAM
jgi:hypothetical protein